MLLRGFTTTGGNGAELADGGQVMPGQLDPLQTAAINLPASLFAIINDRPNVGVFFALYDNSILFPVDGGRNTDQIRRPEVVSDVLAATVGPGIVFENLEENVTVVLRVQVPPQMVSIMLTHINFYYLCRRKYWWI